MYGRRLASLFLLALPSACATSHPQPGAPPPEGIPVSEACFFAHDAPVYLSDLPPLWVSTYTDRYWGFGNHGFLGARTNGALHRITVNGKAFEHSLGTHPPPGESSRVVYALGRRFKTFFGSVGISDIKSLSRSALTFKIVGDGRSLWCSKPIDTPRRLMEFGVNVQDMDRLELVVHCPGSNHAAHAVWIEPRLQREAHRK